MSPKVSLLLLMLIGFSNGINYKLEMKSFIEEWSNVSRSLNANFLVVPQNSLELLTTDDWSEQPDVNFIAHIDAISREDFHFGYESDDRETPITTQREWLPYLNLAKAQNTTVMIVDHCHSEAKQLRSRKLSLSAGFLSVANNRKDLGRLYSANNLTVTSLKSVKNFAINPNYNSTEELTRAANFDMLITTPYLNGEYLKPSEVEQLKHKPSGKRRLLLAMLSTVDIRSDQPYYSQTWLKSTPSWLERLKNTDNNEELKAKYWAKEWKKLMITGDNSVASRLVKLNFDGVYLTQADAYSNYDE